MFIPETPRTRIAVVFVAVMLVLAGCASSGTGVQTSKSVSTTKTTTQESTTETPTATPTPSPTTTTPTSTATRESGGDQASLPTLTADEALTKFKESPPASANLTDVQQMEMQEMVANFRQEIPDNRSEAREDSFAVAGDICQGDSKLDQKGRQISAQMMAGGETAKTAARRMNYAAQILHEDMNQDVPVPTTKRIRDNVGRVTRYTPIIGSYNRLSKDACRANQTRSNESLRDFYISAMVFSADVLLLTTGALHKPAFRVTGQATNYARKVGLWRLRHYCGNRCFALAMSEGYVATYGAMRTVVLRTIEASIRHGVALEKGDVTALAEQYGINASHIHEAVKYEDGRVVGVNLDAAVSTAKNSTVVREGNETVHNVSEDVNETVSDINTTNTTNCANDLVNQSKNVRSDDIGGFVEEASDGVDLDGLTGDAKEAVNETAGRCA